jgi:hypothetical protein
LAVLHNPYFTSGEDLLSAGAQGAAKKESASTATPAVNDPKTTLKLPRRRLHGLQQPARRGPELKVFSVCSADAAASIFLDSIGQEQGS